MHHQFKRGQLIRDFPKLQHAKSLTKRIQELHGMVGCQFPRRASSLGIVEIFFIALRILMNVSCGIPPSSSVQTRLPKSSNDSPSFLLKTGDPSSSVRHRPRKQFLLATSSLTVINPMVSSSVSART